MTGRRILFMMVVALATLVLAVPLTAQETSITLTPYEGNPIFTRDPSLEWEAGGIGRVKLVADDGLYYMFYQGYTAGQTAGGIGYATSEDGLNWSRYEGNPVFTGDEVLAPNGAMNFAILLDGDTWLMLFVPWPEGSLWWTLSRVVQVARATAPSGPWVLDPEPVLTRGGLDWDSGGYWLNTLLHTEDGYVLFYESSNQDIGRADSGDGMVWTRYDDPATTASTFAVSDPVFVPSKNFRAWDRGYVSSPIVRRGSGGWEMFYGAAPNYESRSIGYATSPDGITWTRYRDAPLLLSEPGVLLDPNAVLEVDGRLLLYYTHLVGYDPTTAVIDMAFVES